MRTLLTPIAAIAALASALVSGCTSGVADRPPNVVVIVSDDAGYADFGAFGDPEMATPAIDALAADGVRFTQAYNAASVCSPSRAGLMTGRYPQRFGHEFNLPRRPVFDESPDDLGLPVGETTVADAMRDLGYTTVAIGKWHLGLAEHFHPLERGFGEFFGFLMGSRSYFPLPDDANPDVYLLDGHERQPEPEYLTDALAEAAAARIARLAGQPFFMTVNFNAVHTPMHAKPDDLARFDDVTPPRRRTLAAMTAALDDGVAVIVEALRTAGVENDTILFFVNDNGGATNNASSNGLLRGQKGDQFEGGIRVPMIVRWPSTLPQGADYDHPVTSMDIFPTAVAAGGGDPSGRGLDGVDLMPFLTGETMDRPHRDLFWRRGVIATVRRGDRKLIRVDGQATWAFDLAADPYELHNLIGEDAASDADLVAALEAWEANTVEPRWRTEMVWTENQIRLHTPETSLAPGFPQQAGYTPTAGGAPSTDIYVGQLNLTGDGASVTGVQNVTDRDGYDNQPAFLPDSSAFLYTSARNAQQTDIYRYDVGPGTIRQVTQTPQSEFSATPLPDGGGFSAIQESAAGQFLWRYGIDGAGTGAITTDERLIGYHAWGDAERVVMFVLATADRPATLQIDDIPAGTSVELAENPGRSLHKVPNRRAVSFVRKVGDEDWWIEIYDLDSGEFTRVLQTRPGREDYAWIPDGRLVMGDGTALFIASPGGEWTEIADLSASGITEISRLAISGNGEHIAIVSSRQD